jgi:hypothetical protein
MSEVRLDPEPYDALNDLHEHNPVVADAIEDVLDWIEAEPIDARARRRRFSNGLWAATTFAARADWVVLWEESNDQIRHVRYIGPSTF